MTGDLGRLLVVLGVVLVAVGAALLFADRLPWLGRLPGDIRVERGNWRFYFPLATSLLISVVLTLLVNLFRR
jgi:hypothetical protein